MSVRYHFTFEKDWRSAPLAFWVHVPGKEADDFVPAAPPAIPHKGYAVLHVEMDGVDLQFSSPAQLDHFIDVLSTRPLPTSRLLSSKRGLPVGPNGHWLSRLPAKMKSPRRREKLVRLLRDVRARVTRTEESGESFVPPSWDA